MNQRTNELSFMSYSSHACGHLTLCCGLTPCSNVEVELTKGLRRWHVQRWTQLIHYAIIGAPAESSHLHQACTDIGDARTAGNCRYRNWFNYHSVQRLDDWRLRMTRNPISCDRSRYNRLSARHFHRKLLDAVLLFRSSPIAFNSTPLVQNTVLCLPNKPFRESIIWHSLYHLHLPFL